MNLGPLPLRISGKRRLAYVLIAVLACGGSVRAQRGRVVQAGPTYAPVGTIPAINVGGNYMEAQFARLDFAQMTLEAQKRQAKEKAATQAHNKKLVDSGTVSALDLAAPAKAVNEFNKAASLLKQQRARDAILHLKKAIAIYPNFVSAHNDLGLAYLESEDIAGARREFESAAKLDDKFPGSFLNLGRLALSDKDFATAEAHLQKAVALRPRDPNALSVLAYAQNGAHEYRHAIDTAVRVHGLDHAGVGNVHYVAAAAAIAIKDFAAAQRELTLFLSEDPSSPLVPTARYNLDVLTRNQGATTGAAGPEQAVAVVASQRLQSLPNTERLRSELVALQDETGEETCSDCAPAEAPAGAAPAPAADVPAHSREGWTIRKVVDEVAVFFSVTSRGHIVGDLQESDIRIRDDNKPPEKVLQFTPQSKLPLRWGLLVDTSGSVQPRFAFEKRAAGRFVEQMVSVASDLGFIEGFADVPTVMQDFTGDREQLANGINQLANRGGTALFDAVSFACWKLAGHPDRDRVARVLVVVSDGEDNSSHRTLKQVIQDAEATGVTIYTISTKEGGGVKTDADRVLQALAERSGGEALFPGEMMVLGKSFDKLRDLIRSRYLIAYKPAEFQPNGSFRAISILAEKDGKRLQVHARKGYHARLEANPVAPR